LLLSQSNRAAWSGIICDFQTSLRELINTVENRLRRQTLPTTNRKNFFINILCIESFCLQKRHNRILLFGSILLKGSRHFYYWNQLVNMRTPICYLYCHEAGLLLPSDTYRKPIISITAVLLTLIIYLRTLPCSITSQKSLVGTVIRM
jgi:hypothetical protein